MGQERVRRGCRVSKSKNTIMKPPKVTAANARQVDDILRKVREAQTEIAKKYEEALKAATTTKGADEAAAGAASDAAPSGKPSRSVRAQRLTPVSHFIPA